MNIIADELRSYALPTQAHVTWRTEDRMVLENYQKNVFNNVAKGVVTPAHGLLPIMPWLLSWIDRVSPWVYLWRSYGVHKNPAHSAWDQYKLMPIRMSLCEILNMSKFFRGLLVDGR